MRFFFIFLTIFTLSSWQFIHNESSYQVKKRKELIIQLNANHTTGYSWSCTNVENKYLKLLSTEYEGGSSDFIGAGGIEKWKFKATKKGKITLLFEYKGRGSVAEKKEIEVIIK